MISLTCGAVVTLVFYIILSSGHIPRLVTLVLFVVLMVVSPVAPSLSRRVAVLGALVIGWSPLLWWVRWGVDFNHGALVLALWVGLLVAWIVASPRRGARLKTLRPTVTGVDGLLLVAATTALFVMKNWAFAGSHQRALAVLLPGLDNCAHFFMFAALRTYGAMLSTLGAAPDHSQWTFENYPEGFHALVATMSEVTTAGPASGPQLLLAYTQGVAAVVVFATVVLTASILSLPNLGERPLLALPVVVFVWTAFLWEPGQKILADGFGNFWLAAVAASSALLLSIPPTSYLAPTNLAAICGLFVTVAHSWAPLLVLAAPAAVAMLAGRSELSSSTAHRRRALLALFLLAAGVLATARAIVVLASTVRPRDIITLSGGIDGTSPTPTLFLAVVAFYICFAFPTWLRRSSIAGVDGGMATRIRILGLTPSLGVVSVVSLLIAQMRVLGTTSYYLLKYFMGFELVLAAITPAICGIFIATATRRFQRRWLSVSGCICASLAAAHAFGTFPSLQGALFSEEFDGTASVGVRYSGDAMSEGIVAAASGFGAEGFTTDYIALGSDRAAQAFYPDIWYHAISASLSAAAGSRLDALRVPARDVADAEPLARALLSRDSALKVVVAPEYVKPLRRLLGERELANRIVSWDRTTTQASRP